jgi:TolB-like protein
MNNAELSTVAPPWATGPTGTADACDFERISESMIKEQLARILESSIFVRSSRLSRFLRFVVGSVLRGEAGSLKEYLIGTEVYDRKPTYDPCIDSIVRTEAYRLRRRLKDYYESVGNADPILIYVRTGSYVPIFRLRGSPVSASRPAVSLDVKSSEDASLALAVTPFVDLSEDPLATDLARGVTEELSHQLMRIEGCRVTAFRTADQANDRGLTELFRSQTARVGLVFEGTVRREQSTLEVTSKIVDRNGFQLWSQRFETEANRQDFLRITKQIVSALISRARPQDVGIQFPNAASGLFASTMLNAEALLDEGGVAEVRKALVKFERLAEEMPDCARVHSDIGQCYFEIALSGIAGSSDAALRAKISTLKALALCPQLHVAHGCLGSILAFESNWTDARKSFKHSLNLGEDPASYRQYALLLTAAGQFDEAKHYLTRSHWIDPFSNRQKVAWMKFLYFSRQYDEALRCFTGRHIYGPLPPELKLYLAFTHLQLGQSSNARRLAQAVLEESFSLPCLMAYVAEILAYCGDTNLAARIVENHNLRTQNSPISKVRQASLAIAFGESENAITLLKLASDEDEPELLWIGVDPRFDSVRGSVRVGNDHRLPVGQNADEENLGDSAALNPIPIEGYRKGGNPPGRIAPFRRSGILSSSQFVAHRK